MFLMGVEEYVTYRYQTDMLGVVILFVFLFAYFIFWLIDKK